MAVQFEYFFDRLNSLHLTELVHSYANFIYRIEIYPIFDMKFDTIAVVANRNYWILKWEIIIHLTIGRLTGLRLRLTSITAFRADIKSTFNTKT